MSSSGKFRVPAGTALKLREQIPTRIGLGQGRNFLEKAVLLRTLNIPPTRSLRY